MLPILDIIEDVYQLIVLYESKGLHRGIGFTYCTRNVYIINPRNGRDSFCSTSNFVSRTKRRSLRLARPNPSQKVIGPSELMIRQQYIPFIADIQTAR